MLSHSVPECLKNVLHNDNQPNKAMRIAVLSYGSLVACPKSEITQHDIEVQLPFRPISKMFVAVRLGMMAYSTKLTSCIDEKSKISAQVYFALSLHDDVQTAVRAFALREGCSTENIAVVYAHQTFNDNEFRKSVAQWLRSNNLDAALYANFDCTLTQEDARQTIKDSNIYAQTREYALNRVPQPSGRQQWQDLIENKVCKRCLK